MAAKDLNSKVDVSTYTTKMNEINQTFTKSEVTSGDIHQLQKNNKNIYPKTTTEAVYEGSKTLSSILEDSIFSEPHNNESVLVPDPDIVQKVNSLENKFEEYLPLTGGILSGEVSTINSGFKSTSTGNSIGRFLATDDHVFISNETSAKYLQLYNDGTLRYSGLKIYHEGNRPYPSDIGAIATSGDKQTISGGLIVTGGTLTAEGNISTPNIYSDVTVMTADSGKVGTGVLEINGNGNDKQYWFNVDQYGNLVCQARHKAGWYSNPFLANKDYVQIGVELRTNYDNSFNIGNSNARWKAVYAANGTIQTSDMRMKSDIRDIDDEIFFNMIKNTGVHSYVLNYKDMPEGITQEEAPEEQVHVGIIAQEMDQYEGSRYILNVDENGQYSINNYNLTSAVMAALKVEIAKREELENEVKELKDELKEIKNLLNSNK